MITISIVGRPVLSGRAVRRPVVAGGWLVTFADLTAVMVAFFVLLFSMSEIDTHRWGGAAQALDRQFDLRAQDDAARSGVTVGDTRFAVGEGDALGYPERGLAGQDRKSRV